MNLSIIYAGPRGKEICEVCGEEIEYRSYPCPTNGDTDVATCDNCEAEYCEGELVT